MIMGELPNKDRELFERRKHLKETPGLVTKRAIAIRTS